MGHPWKKARGKPGLTSPEYWGSAYPLFEDGTIARLVKIGREQKRISGMNRTCQDLQKKNRLLKRKISEFYRQGEEYGKSSNKRRP
jgi:hypothetical protein